MFPRMFRLATLAAAAALQLSVAVRAQNTLPSPRIDLTVSAGRPLRIALDRRVNVKRVGQPVAGTLIDPVYAYDRVVVPSGTPVRGHVAALEKPSRLVRIHALASGDFSPNRRVVVQFDALVLAGGREVPIRTRVNGAAPHIALSVAAAGARDRPDDDDKGIAGRARDRITAAKQEARQKARDALAAIKGPDKLERVKALLIDRLPYHPQYLSQGTIYVAELLAPLDFAPAPPSIVAPPGTLPAPESILAARLVTPLDSAKTRRGTPIEAVVTEPVFSADHRLVLPEGSRLTGEVTFAAAARRFHRNGRLRFLLESVQPPNQDAARLLASLYSVQVPDANAVELDEEGGARATDSKKRFIAPALAVLALRASTHREPRRMDDDPDDSLGPRAAGDPSTRGIGGFFGWGLAGAAASQLSHPVGVAFAAIGVARTVYGAVFGKGREVAFPAGTAIQVQLAPGPASRK